MNCSIIIDAELHPALANLEDKCNDKNVNFLECLKSITSGDMSSGIFEFNASFTNYWNNKFKSTNLDMQKTSPNTLAKTAIEYYNFQTDIAKARKKAAVMEQKVILFGYDSIATRTFAKRYVANMILGNYNNLVNKKNYSYEELYDESLQRAIGNVKTMLVNRLSKELNINKEEIKSKIGNFDSDYLHTIDTDKLSDKLKNLLATYIELTTKNTQAINQYNANKTNKNIDDEPINYHAEFIKEVFWDSRLSSIKTPEQMDVDDIIAEENLNTDSTIDTDTTVAEGTYDDTIQTYENHLGNLKSFAEHITPTLKVALSSVYKCADYLDTNDNIPPYDLNNPLGVPDVHDANMIASILYTQGSFYSSPDDMVARIRQLSKTLPGYSGLKLLADKFEQYPSLKAEAYVTFSKMPINKLRTTVLNDNIGTDTSNITYSAADVLRFTYFNSYKTTALSNDPAFSKELFDDINERYDKLLKEVTDDDIDNNEADLYIDDISRLLSFYLPIDKNTIKLFVRNYNKGNKLDNIDVLLTRLKDIIKNSNTIQTTFNKLQKRRSEAYYRNKQKILDNILNPGTYSADDFEDVNAISLEEYMTDADAAPVLELAKELLDYSVVNIDLNSTNPHGNQSSSVINNSTISNLMEIFQSSLNNDETIDNNSPLMNLFKHKHQSQQYDNSNILIERRDNGKITNYGLFKLDKKGNYVPTEYATQLIRFSLFDGAENRDNGKSVLYNEMTSGDYIGTAWANFFNTQIVKSDKLKIETAEYFLRTPSDSKNIFTIRAPKFSVRGLMTVSNTDELNKLISEEVTTLFKQANTSIQAINRIPITKNTNNNNLTSRNLLTHVRLDGTSDVKIHRPAISNIEGKQVTLKFVYASDTENETIYYISGTYENGILYKAKFEGFGKTNETYITKELTKALNNELDRTGEINGTKRNYTINTKHPIFIQLQNAFKQEIINAITALHVMFEDKVLDEDKNLAPTEQRHIAGQRYPNRTKHSGELIFRKGSNKNHNHLIEGYHYTGDKVVTYKDGIPYLTGRVFKSNHFTIYDEKTGKETNYGQEIIDESIDFLYGGAKTKELQFTVDENDNVNVIFTKEMNDKIEEKLSNFINDYVSVTANRLQSSIPFIKTAMQDGSNSNVNVNNIAEFILNYILIYFASDDLIEGDSKFYKDALDELKRAKASNAAGSKCAMASIASGFDNLTSGELDAISENLPEGLELRKTFNAVTIKNSIKTDTDTIERLINKLVNDCGLSKENATKLMKGYEDAIVNDAQSYITLDEWVRRIIGRGQYHKYENLIKKLYANEKLTNDDLTEFVQVQKNVYFDLHYDDDTKTISPRFIKNAEFVLVPQFVEGTELEYVLKLMQKHGIDQLNTRETSKAAKSKILEVFDSKTGKLIPEIKDEIDGKVKVTNRRTRPIQSRFTVDINRINAISSFDYAHLYTQQETKQHVFDVNKAGIQLMKKIIDNINKNDKLYTLKKHFFDLYTTNINDSFKNLMDEFNIKLTPNGNLVLDENGEIPTVNFKEFFTRFSEELSRLGLDSNMVDYVTLINDNTGATRMPTYDPLVAQKLENIAQAIFNNNITKQMLPGFHAAQVSNIGFTKLFDKENGSIGHNGNLQYHPQLYKNTKTKVEITEQEYNSLPKEEKANYTKAGIAPYVEVMLSAKAFGFDRNAPAFVNMSKERQDDEFFRQLRVNGLDSIIGYRIPTEGKQSICIMKVVGFIDDAQGSTIIVPDMWVPQTGSDFDIDSVYGIQKNVNFDSNGNINTIEYYSGEKAGDDERLYMRYIRRSLGDDKWNEIIESKKLDKSLIDKIFKETREEVRNDTSLPEIVQKNREVNREVVRDKAVSKIKEYSRQIFEEELNDAITENNLLSFNEYNKLSYEERNSRKARENELIQTMIDILSDDSSLEENLSRSNFDDISDAKKEIYNILPSFKKARNGRTAYDFLDQAAYQVDATSGMKLKGFSVSRDNLCSIFNTVRPTLAEQAQVEVIYTFNEKEIEDKIKELKESFDFVEKISKNKVKVTHNTIGYTKNNRNVVGKLLTPYSSQTTAFCLDVMKVGNIPNVNDFTFGVFKVFPDLGSDYRTAISFMMQPGVTEIVKNYESVHSIYADTYGANHVQQTIYDLASKLKVDVTKKTEIDKLFQSINEKYGNVLSKLFDSDVYFSMEEKYIKNIPFNSELQIERLKDNLSSPVEGISKSEINALYDIVTCLQYYKLSMLADDLRNYGFVLNLDKSGARQTIFETNAIFDNIINLANKKDSRLLIDGKNAITRIYPDANLGLVGFSKSRNNDSVYPPAFTFLKKVTAPSILINRKLFITQSESFVSYIKEFENILSYEESLNEKQTKEIQNYIISTLNKQVSFINTPLRYILNKGFVYRQNAAIDSIFKYVPNLEEQSRVFGYNHNPDFSIYEEKVEVKENKYYSGSITPSKDTIFVFGSNPDGIHGAGAAYTAKTMFGAIQGQGEGLQGNSYALPTKDLNKARGTRWYKPGKKEENDIKEWYKNHDYLEVEHHPLNVERSMTPQQIINSIKTLYNIAKQNPSKQFKISHYPFGKLSLNGYLGEEMLAMFIKAGEIPSNIIFNEEWKSQIEKNVTSKNTTISGNIKKVTIKDLSNPTQQELDDFAELSPAQKVKFIQLYFKDSGIFNYLDASLHNTGKNGTYAGRQTIRFNESITDKETAYTLFYQAFTSENPLFALAAMDLVKYSYIVEGRTFKKTSVSKIIKNDVLLADSPIYGTGIVDEMNYAIQNIQTYSNDDLKENFIRSHSTYIPTRRVTFDKNSGYEIKQKKNGIIVLPKNNETINLMLKYGIAYNSEQDDKLMYNSYVNLAYGKRTELYKITEKVGIGIVLYPLNKLESYENDKWSANMDNNTRSSKDYYERVIDEYYRLYKEQQLSTYSNEVFDQALANINPEDYKLNSKLTRRSGLGEPLVISRTSSLGVQIVKAINGWYDTAIDTNTPSTFIVNNQLSTYLPKIGDKKIIKVNREVNGHLEEVKVTLTRLNVSNIISKYVLNNNKPSDNIKDIVNFLKERKESWGNIAKDVSNVYSITDASFDENEEGIVFSTKNDFAKNSVALITDSAYQSNDRDARELTSRWRREHINRYIDLSDKESGIVLAEVAHFVTKKAKEITDAISYFEIPGSDERYPINSDEVINAVKANEEVRIKFLRTIQDSNKLINQFKEVSEVIIDSNDDRTRKNLEKIKDALGSLSQSTEIYEAKKKYIEEYIDKQSNNPWIKAGLMSVIDGFYSSDYIESMFNDIQEAPSPLIQVVMKETMTNLRAAEMNARKKVDSFVKKIDELKKKAADEGLPFDFKNIIDEYGRFKQPYNEKFLQDRDKLQTAKNEAKIYADEIGETKGRTSTEFIKAYKDFLIKALEYDEWKAKYLEQPIVQEYYDKKNALRRKILFGEPVTDILTGETNVTGLAPYVYTIYEILKEDRATIKRQFTDDGDDPELDKQLNEINNAIANLTSTTTTDPITGEQVLKEDTISRTEDDKIKNATRNLASAINFKEFREEEKRLYDEYYKYDVAIGFFEECEKNQRIVDDAEKRVNGKITASASELEHNEQYIHAKNWLRRNARKRPVVDDTTKTDWFKELQDAYAVLKDNPKKTITTDVPILKAYRDENGEIDMIEFFKTHSNPIAAINTLRKNKENRLLAGEGTTSTERIANSAKDKDKVVFTRGFYDSIAGVKSLDTVEAELFRKEWNRIVKEINDILTPYYFSGDNKRINFNELVSVNNTNTLNNVVDNLRKLKKLFKELEDLQDRSSDSLSKDKKKKRYEFIKNNVSFEVNDEAYNIDLLLTEDKVTPTVIRDLLNEIIHQVDPETGDRIPNRYLYSSLTLKLDDNNAIEKYLAGDESDISEHDLKAVKEFVDKKRTNAIRTIEKYTYSTTTKYYSIIEQDVRNGNAEKYGYKDYRDWYYANHVYNPRNGRFEPINVWLKTEYKENADYVWEPLFPQQVSKISDGYDSNADKTTENYDKTSDKRNKNYKPGSHALNYKGGFSEYDAKIKANKYELEAKELIEDEILGLITTDKAKRRFEEGWLPAMGKVSSDVKNPKFWVKELGKFLGYNELVTGYEDWIEDQYINYNNDKEVDMPMMNFLRDKNIYEKERQFNETWNNHKPRRIEFKTESEYLTKVAEYEKQRAALEKEKIEVHKALIEEDPVKLISNFILQASNHNAVQKSKYQLYFAKEIVENYGVYTSEFGGLTKFKAKGSHDNRLEKTIDKNLQEQLANTIRRLVYDQWTNPKGRLSKWTSILQSFTSAKYMMFNLKGGVANITLGSTQMWGESFAAEQLGAGDKKTSNMILAKASGDYIKHIPEYAAHAYDEEASSLEGACIKFFDVIDYDQHTGIAHLTANAAELLEKVRNTGYFQQSAGEHYMQNRMLLALLMSNVIVPNESAAEFGQPAYKFVNFQEYIGDAQEQLLKQYLDEKQKEEYEKAKKALKDNPNMMKDYAWFRKDLIQEFRKKLDINKRQEFADAWDKRKEELSNEYKSKPTIMSQLELGADGKLAIKTGSLLSQIDIAKPDGSPTDAIKLLAAFKGRVISVNKKIHGVYDKTGRAQIEKTWIGGLLMQYHKHLPMGLLKRYRRKGYYNEERGSIEKGMYVSLWDYLTTPWTDTMRQLKYNKKELLTLKGLKNYLTNALNFMLTFKLTYREMPEYDKANMKRMLGDILGGGVALAVVLALKALAESGDVDDDDNLYNFALYQADRLATESLMYSAITLPSEVKKTWMSPIAGFNGFNDVFITGQTLLQWIFDDDFDMYYQTGKYAGRNRLSVRFENNIPIWRGIKSSIFDMADNNKYYKVGKNIIGIAGAY